MLSSAKINFTDKEIIEKGSRALIKELGYSGFLRFIRQIESSGEDYLSTQEDLYKNVPLDKLFKKASEAWDKKEQQS